MSFLSAIRAASHEFKSKFFEQEIETKGWEELRAGIMTASGTGAGTLAPTVQTYQALRKYRSWVYPCVNLISSKVTTVPYYLYQAKHKNNKEAFERVVEHPVIRLLEKPNDFLSGRQLKKIIQLHLELCGFAMVKIIRNGAGQPKQLFPYYPQELIWIELGTTTDQLIKAFHFAPIQNRHKVERIPYQDMLYFHYPHPENPYMPCTPIQALAHVTDIDLFLQVYTKSFFENGARPDFVIIPEKQIGKVAAERVSEGWMARFRGPGKNFKPAVLSDNVKIQQLSMSAHDFEFLAMSSWTQDNILAAYGVPKVLMGLMSGSSKSDNLAAQTIFVENCIAHRLHLFEDVINSQLVSQYRNLEGYTFEHANAVPRDDEWQTAKDQSDLSTGKISLNEIRRREGDKPWPSPLANVPFVNGQPLPGCDPEADKLWKDMQAPPPNLMAPAMGEDPTVAASNDPNAQGAHGVEGGRPEGRAFADMVKETLRNSRPNLAMLLNAAQGRRGGLATLVQTHPEVSNLSQLLPPERRDMVFGKLLAGSVKSYLLDEYAEDESDYRKLEICEKMLDVIVPLQDQYQDSNERFFIAKGVEIADIVKKNFSDFVMKGIEVDIDEQALKEEYKDQFGIFVVKAFEAGAGAGWELIPKGNGNDLLDQQGYAQAIKRGSVQFLDQSADLQTATTKKTLVKIIQEGFEKGLDSEIVGEMIVKKFQWIGTHRAEMIARSQLAAAAWAGADFQYRQINKNAGHIIVKKSTLLPTLGERTCKTCLSKKGDTVVDYETNSVEIEGPIHPYCGCLPHPET